MTSPDVHETVRHRESVLAALVDGPVAKRDLAEYLDISRSTLDRAIRELDEHGLAERADGGYIATTAGTFALEQHRRHQRKLETISEAKPLLDELPADCDLPLEVVTGSDVILAADPTPYKPLETLHETIHGAERYRGLLPTLDDSRHLQLCYDHVVVDRKEATMVVGEDLLKTFEDEFPQHLSVLCDQEQFTLQRGPVPSYGLVLTTARRETTVTVVVFDREQGGVCGILRNDTEEGREWAIEQFEAVTDESTDVSEEFRDNSDAGAIADGSGVRSERSGSVRASPSGDSLPVSLQSAGFARLSPWFFANRRVADPATAWRAGLDLTDVYAGYAVPRFSGEGAGKRTLAERTLTTLESGTNCLVVGPPGSGKSTLCKRVACEWYAAKRGPVLYREHGRGQPFDAVDDLVAWTREAPGQPLVVVEDAVRPNANAIFEALERLETGGDRSPVVLLDARDGEWHDVELDVPGAVRTMETVAVPPLSDEEYDLFVEQFRATTGTTADLPVGQLREAVREHKTTADGTAPGEVLLLLHRLSTYVAPTGSEGTGLEDDAREVYETLADVGETALDICTLASLLNVAGIAITDGSLYALAEDGDFERISQAIDQLADRVLFGRTPDGDYRTVHETWSTAFLETLRSVEGTDAARDRVGTVLTALLSLADERERRETLAATLAADDPVGPTPGPAAEMSTGRADTIAVIDEEPGDWANDVLKRVLSVARRLPTLAAFLGTGAGTSFELPDVCGTEIREQARIQIGWALADAGEYDHAEALFDRLNDDGDTGVDRNLGLATIAKKRGNHDTAQRYAHAARDAALDDVGRGRAENLLGEIARNQGAYETAREKLRLARETFASAGDQRREAKAVADLAMVEKRLQNYDTARELYEQGRTLYAEIGYRPGEGTCLQGLGKVARAESDGLLTVVPPRWGDVSAPAPHEERTYDQAVTHTRQAIEIFRRVGKPHGEANSRSVLGAVELRRGNLDAAAQHYRSAREIYQTLDLSPDVAATTANLGLIARMRGDTDTARERLLRARKLFGEFSTHYEAQMLFQLGVLVHDHEQDPETARDYFERSLRLCREVGDQRYEAGCLYNLARLSRDAGELETAETYLHEGVETARQYLTELGADDRQLTLLDAVSALERGELAHERGDVADARRQYEATLRLVGEIGDNRGAADALTRLGTLARERGNLDAARDYHEQAVDAARNCEEPPLCLDALEALVDTCAEQDDTDAAIEWCRRAVDVADEAGEERTEQFETRLGQLQSG